MSSPSQISANQINAASSTGPRSPEGKEASSRNSLKHGLSSGFCILPNEDRAEFDALLETLRAEFQPATSHETFLVETMAQARWRLARINRFEEAAFQQLFREGNVPEAPTSVDGRIVHGLSQRGGGDPLSLLQRYAAAAERSYYKAHKELVQNRRAEMKLNGAAMNHYIENVVFAPLPKIGFVSQNSQNAPQPPSAAPTQTRGQALGNLALRL